MSLNEGMNETFNERYNQFSTFVFINLIKGSKNRTSHLKFAWSNKPSYSSACVSEKQHLMPLHS